MSLGCSILNRPGQGGGWGRQDCWVQNLVPTHGPGLSGVEGCARWRGTAQNLGPHRGRAEASADPKSSGNTGCPIVVPPLAWWGLRLRDNGPSQDSQERVVR